MTSNQISLPFADDPAGSRATLVARWSALVKNTLPQMSAQHQWPISNDHCFMRVCLDAAIGQPWHLAVKRPAIRNLSDEQLIGAIAVAESLVYSPQTLDALNRQSIAWRNSAGKSRK
jgi:hypothetical protein